MVMDVYKGELMMTQMVKIDVKLKRGGSGGTGCSAAVTDTVEHTVPLLRLLYSFHSSGTEIKELLGQAPSPYPSNLYQPINHQSHSPPADTLQPEFISLPDRPGSNIGMPEWLQLRAAQCSLTFTDGKHDEDFAGVAAESAGCMLNAGVWGHQHRQAEPCADAAKAPALQQLRQQPPLILPQIQPEPACPNLRWLHLVDPASLPSIILPAATSTAPLHQSAPADVLHAAPTTTVQPRPLLLSDCVEASSAAIDLIAAPEPACAARSHTPHKKRKRRKKRNLLAILSSPPKIHKHDPEFQDYLARKKLNDAFVRQAVLGHYI